MKMMHKCLYLGAMIVLFAVTSRSDVVTQNFEAFPAVGFNNGPNNVQTNGWTINDVLVQTEATTAIPPKSGTKAAFLPDKFFSGIANPTNSYIETPLLTNGVGSVSYYLYNSSGGVGGPYNCQLQINTNGTDWVTVASVDNTGNTGWIGYTNTINYYDDIRIRWFRSTALNDYSWVGVDEISTTEASAKVDISDVAISPAQPTTDDAVYISAILTPSTLATITNVDLLWSADGGSSNTINMSYNGGSGRYETDTDISSQPVFTVIEYSIRVTFSGPTALSPATAPGTFFFRKPPAVSIYSSVTAKGDLTQALDLVDDGVWTGVKSVSARGQTDLYFETVNGGTQEWRDPSPTRTVLPLSGNLTTGAATNISIDGTDAGWLLYGFDETTPTYTVEQAQYQSFDTWTTLNAYDTTSVVDDWSVTRARSVNSAGLPYDGYALQFQDTTSERAIAAPYLTNGVESIQFLYRNTATNGLSPASFSIQTKADAGDAWSTQDSVSNIISPDYLFYRLNISRFEWKYVRLVVTGPAIGQLLIENLAVTTLEHPADVTIVSHGIDPANPRSDETVTFYAQLVGTAPTLSTNATVALSTNGSPVGSINLSYNAGAGRFEGTLPTNLPVLTIIDYDLEVTFTGPHAEILSPNNVTNNFYLRNPLPQSPYSEINLAGDLTDSLDLTTNNYWIGIVPVGVESGLAVYFESVNGTTNQWNDPAPLRTSLPVFGAFAISTNAADDITIDDTEAGWLLASFDEDNGRYGIQQADYQSFNTWISATAFGDYEIDNWTLLNGRTITNSPLAYDGYSVQFESTTTERAIESPEQPNGIGSLAFRYRNTETDILSPASLAIQVRATTNQAWQTLETITGIVSPDYSYHEITVASLDQRYIRIAALNGTAAAQLLIDDIIVTRPGATVTFSGLTHTPNNPTVTNTVDVDIDITALNGAALNTVTLWFRGEIEQLPGAPTHLPITFDNFSGRGTLTDFPALIKLTPSNTDNYADFLDTVNGYDLRFYDDQSFSGTALDYEIESFDASGTSYIWVKVPALTHNTTIWATWGEDATQQSSTTDGSVWSEGFGGVWHLADDVQDSTANGNDGAKAGSTETDGMIGRAQLFDGAGDDINCGNDASLKNANTITASCWMRASSITQWGGVIGRGNDQDYELEYPNTSSMRFRVDNDSGQAPSTSVSLNTWYHMAATYGDGANSVKIYQNGVLKDTRSTGAIANRTANLWIGSRGGGNEHTGEIDEARVSTVARSANWIWAEYMNQGPNHSAFVDYGAVVDATAGLTAPFDPITMTNTTGDHYTGTIPRGDIGQMQYYVEASYLNPATGGYQSNNEPLDVTGMPAAYTNTDVLLIMQDFEAFPGVGFSAGPSNVETNGWTINDVLVQTEATSYLTPKSPTRVAWLPDTAYSGIANPTNCYIESPLMTNGIGSVTYYLFNSQGASYGPYTCELQVNTNGTDWITIESIDNSGKADWVGYTNTINYYGPVRLRWFRSTDLDDYSWVGVDDISMTYPPVYVAASDFEEHPAYPSQEEPTTVACTIESATTYHPAFNISGILRYRVNDQINGWTDWNSAGMTRIGSRFYGEVPVQLDLSDVEYDVEAHFNGYSADGEELTPMEFPESPLDYTVRRYISAYSNVSVRIGGEDVATLTQLDNQTWEGIVLFVDPTNGPAFEIGGYGYYDGTNVTGGLTTEWGDNDVSITNLPLAGTGSVGGLPIVIPGDVQGQYLITFNELTGDYSVQRVVYQDFENWPADSLLFGESYAAARITEHAQNFSTWPLGDLDIISSDFEEGGWPPSDDYPDTWVITSGTSTEGTNVTYKIQGGIIVTQRVGQAALLGPGVQGHVRNITLRKDDAGQFSFDLRCASPNDFRPAIHPAVTNTHMRIDARIRTSDIPTNSSLDSIGYAYKSILGNYIDSNNYYEGRVVQISATQKRYELWEKTGGALNSRGTPQTVNGTIKDNDVLQLKLYWNSPSEVKIRFTVGGKNVNYTDSSALTPTYVFGLNALDTSTAVDYTRVYAITNSSYEIDVNVVYEENFSSGASGWDSSSGAWSVSDGAYQRNGYTLSPLTAKMQFSENAVDWDDVATFTNLTHSYYKRYTGYPHTATSGYVRVLFEGGSGGEYMIIDNVERQAWKGEAVTTTNNWQGTNLWVDTTGNPGRGAEMRNSRAVGNADQWILSPPLTGGASVVSFDYKAADESSEPLAFDIYYTRSDVGPDTWYPSTSYTNSTGATDWIPYSHSIDDRSLAIKISRIRVRNQTPGHDVGLLIDNLTVTEPPPINDTTWWGYNVLVTDQEPEGILVDNENPWLLRQADNQFGAFLNNSSTNDTGEGITNDLYYPFIRSAYLSEGIGDIRFNYRAWDTNTSQIQIVGSTNQQAVDAEWTILRTVVVNDTSYNEYSANLFHRNYHYLGFRVFSKNGSLGRVGIDNILVTGPVSADVQLRDLRLDPAIPTDDDLVFVEVEVGDPFYNPQNVKIWMHYIIGTNSWGAYTNGTPQQMVEDGMNGDYTVYRTEYAIPQRNIDDVVQFRVEATFEGLNADKASPKAYSGFSAPDHYWPIDLNRNQINRTPYYIVFSCLPGQVWINELNVADAVDFTPTYNKQYVELIGVGGVNVGNWRIESINTDYSTNASYSIATDTMMATSDDDYGFYVLGNTNTITPTPDMALTNTFPDGGGIQLIRGVWNIIEDQVSYDVGAAGGGQTMSQDTDRRYVYAGVDQVLFSTYPLSLIDDGGPGSNKTDFAWSQTTGDFSHIGTTNINQTILPWPTNGPPVGGNEYTGTASIGTASWGGGLVYFDISTQSPELVPSVWYVTNLLNVTSNDWQRQTSGFGWSLSNTTYSVWCDEVPPPVFYSIKVNTAP